MVHAQVYEGQWCAGKKEGRGTHRYASGNVKVGCYRAGADFGEGAKWSADRQKALLLRDGAVVQEISLEKEATVAARVGVAVP